MFNFKNIKNQLAVYLKQLLFTVYSLPDLHQVLRVHLHYSFLFLTSNSTLCTMVSFFIQQ